MMVLTIECCVPNDVLWHIYKYIHIIYNIYDISILLCKMYVYGCMLFEWMVVSTIDINEKCNDDTENGEV